MSVLVNTIVSAAADEGFLYLGPLIEIYAFSAVCGLTAAFLFGIIVGAAIFGRK